ncbi:nucleotidyltransferase domain-containing protein [Azospirillum sp. SYSU D00513]|uniref:nucleotidyltransferase family protein n=1 Tax=Azospirillum sp. SYSU D00513 TaxID=2812561 RepID=UPI001FFF148B|nr:nucleotidyltransferase domain-containing protein [Azospirillum sp. SYSU D00513]
MIDSRTLPLIQAIMATLRAHYGDALVAVYLFDSRARGDHREDSDVDLAVALRDPKQPLVYADMELVDLTYDLQVEAGLYVQPWALPLTAMEGQDDSRAKLAATVKAEGRLVGLPRTS